MSDLVYFAFASSVTAIIVFVLWYNERALAKITKSREVNKMYPAPSPFPDTFHKTKLINWFKSQIAEGRANEEMINSFKNEFNVTDDELTKDAE